MSLATIVFVIPWYGADQTGGAERECRRTAEQLASRNYPVEVVTTCARSFNNDWGENYFAPGTETINGVKVRRFRVQRRDRAIFNSVNHRLLRGEALSQGDENIFMQEMIGSAALLAHIKSRRDPCRFVFIPYMFSTTFRGAQIRPADSFMIPCMHDEPYAQLSLFKALMPRLRGFILHSVEEHTLMRSLYSIPEERLHVIGEGVDDHLTPDASRFRQEFGIENPFLLYIGRKDTTKNTPLLLEYFVRYKMQRGGELILVTLGAGDLPSWAKARPDIRDFRVVDDRAKVDALGAALCLVNPSVRESFSLVLMESWLTGRPAMVHADCAVTAGYCRASHGGLEFRDYPEFAAAVRWIQEHPEAATQMGRQGQTFVRSNFQWDKVIERLVRTVYETSSR